MSSADRHHTDTEHGQVLAFLDAEPARHAGHGDILREQVLLHRRRGLPCGP